MLETAISYPSSIMLTCEDGVTLGGHFWRAQGQSALGKVIINPATGVAARYYHRYAAFLNQHGFDVLTYDYRGIGLSRPPMLKGCPYCWHHWGTLDFSAAVDFMARQPGTGVLQVVGHSFGGFLPGLASNCDQISRMLTVGAQFGWWRDYAIIQRPMLALKWHVVMPVLAQIYGYFPGSKLGWLEDLPKGVASEWALGGRQFEDWFPAQTQTIIRTRFQAVHSPILAVSLSDDPLAPLQAVRRGLARYTNAPRQLVQISPRLFGLKKIGHFDLFHDRHRAGFWRDSLRWLQSGENPWPAQIRGHRLA